MSTRRQVHTTTISRHLSVDARPRGQPQRRGAHRGRPVASHLQELRSRLTGDPRDGSYFLRQSGICLLLWRGAAALPSRRAILIGTPRCRRLWQRQKTPLCKSSHLWHDRWRQRRRPRWRWGQCDRRRRRYRRCDIRSRIVTDKRAERNRRFGE